MENKEFNDKRLLATQTINFAAAVADRDETSKAYDDEGLFARSVDGRLIRVHRATADDFDTDIRLTIDGQEVIVKKAVPLRDSQGSIQRDAQGNAVPRATTIYDAATEAFVKRAGDTHPIPTLCHREHLPPVGACRVCMVEAVEQTRRGVRSKLVPSCVQHVSDGMAVHTINSKADRAAAQRVKKACSLLTELLVADHLPDQRSNEMVAINATGQMPPRLAEDGNELAALASRLNLSTNRFSKTMLAKNLSGLIESPAPPPLDKSSRMVVVNLEQCILCGRCSRGCNYVKENHVIGRFGKGYQSHIGFDLDVPMGKSSCVSCGECVISCPTGALEFRPSYLAAAAASEGHDQPTNVRDILAIPLFAGLPPKFVQFNQSSFVVRQLKAGEVLCREGEYGSTAFVIVSGRFMVTLQSKRGKSKKPLGLGFLRWLGGGGGETKHSTVARLSDMHGAELSDDTVIEITPDDVIIGEMTCLNRYPRSATVVAKESSVVVEIRRNVLYMIQRNAISREFLDQVYRKRTLRGQLTSLPIFQGLSEEQRQEAADYLNNRVELLTVEPGQTIYRQGEIADAIYINRLGFIKVTQKYGVSDRVMGYVSPGSYFGEIGLLSKLVNSDQTPGRAKIPDGRRTASCAALDHVELIRIKAADFHELLRKLPALAQPMLKVADEILARDYAIRKQLDAIGTDDFIDQGLFLGQSLLVLDLEKCTRCDECTKACADTHGGVTRLVRDGLRFDKFLVASSCRSCMDPYCLVGCPVDAIHRDGNSLEIKIEDYCIGCGLCSQNCPYGNINMHGFPKIEADPKTGKRKAVFEDRNGRKIPVIQQKATTCDLCRSIDGKPRCVYACPHDAAHRMSGQQLLKIVERGGLASLE